PRRRGGLRRGRGRPVHVCRAMSRRADVRRKAARAPLPREGPAALAQRFPPLADATRLGLLQSIFERERSVQELCDLTGASQANASKHLALLLEQGLVARRRDGLYTRYRLADPALPAPSRLVLRVARASH